MEVGPGAQTRAAHPADHLALAHPIPLLHIQLTEVAVEGAAPGAVVLPLDRQAVASRQANYSPPGAQGRPIAAGMHQPAAQQTHQGTEL